MLKLSVAFSSQGASSAILKELVVVTSLSHSEGISLGIPVDSGVQGGLSWGETKIHPKYKATCMGDCINWMDFSLKTLHGKDGKQDA